MSPRAAMALPAGMINPADRLTNPAALTRAKSARVPLDFPIAIPPLEARASGCAEHTVMRRKLLALFLVASY
jgi:hypothetical protein